ncbi:tetratricopeptide repeat protein [Hyphococcus sp.]|uniref:tetratricopeptide repeat protein n=1 Tax=Hyphococcus sp. TaxID=2038636 RepID=UPI002087C762|nr:MAG: hypothetical protein DHS20C04_14010 [Marinicaulis sp.]
MMKATAGTNGRLTRHTRNLRVSRLVAVSLIAMAAACASPEQKVERYSTEAAEFLKEGDLGKAYIQYQNALKINEEHVPSMLGLADIAEKRQDFQAMFGFLQNAIRLDPTQIDAHIKLGKLYLIGSDESTALEQAEKALEIDPDNIEAKALKSAVMLKIGDRPGALALAKEVLEVDPANAEAVTVVVTNFSVNGDWESALAELDRALALNPQVAILQLLRIHALKTLGRDDETRDAYANLIELFPEQAVYRRVYANELAKGKDFAGARKQLEAIVELEPENLSAKLDVIRIVKIGESTSAAEAVLTEYAAADSGNTDLQFALADFYIGEKNSPKAKAVLEKLAASKDNDIALRAKNKITSLLFGEGKQAEAEALIDEILKADERNTDGLLKRAALQIQADQFDQAIVNLRTVLDNNPDSYEAMLLMSAAFEKQDNFSFAQAQLAKAFEASKKNAQVANQYSRFLLRRKNLARAEEVLVDSLAVNPGNVVNLRLLASIRLTQQDWRGAEEVGVMLENAGDGSALAANIKSAAYIGLDDFDSVIDTLSARNQNAPLDAQPLTALVGAYIRQERTDEAKDLLQRMLQDDPDNYTAQVLLARVFAAQKDKANFESTLVSATEKNSDRPEAYEMLYRSYLADGRRDEAAALIDGGLRASPDNEALKVFKADVLLTQGDREGALALYSELIRARPNDRIIANNFVSLSSDMRLDEASIARALEVAKAIESLENPFYRDTVGWAYYRAGQYGKALEYLTQAAAGAEGNAEILYHLGAAQQASGDSAAARETLEKALSTGGANFIFADEVRSLLAAL